MSIVLDVGAGVLLAHGVRATATTFSAVASEDARGGEYNPIAFGSGVAVVVLGTLFVAWRIIGLP